MRKIIPALSGYRVRQGQSKGGQRSYNNVSDRRARTKAVNVAIVMVGLSDSEGC